MRVDGVAAEKDPASRFIGVEPISATTTGIYFRSALGDVDGGGGGGDGDGGDGDGGVGGDDGGDDDGGDGVDDVDDDGGDIFGYKPFCEGR